MKRSHIILIIVVLVVVIGGWKVAKYSAQMPDSNLYQVVLLANDQVFYGKLHAPLSRFPYLTDVYYLNQNAPLKGAVNATFTVVKRGVDEIHKPVDKMYIARDKILYWENVGSDSRVAEGIKKEKERRAGMEKK